MRVLQLGAAGFVPKSLDTDMLTNAIEFVLRGGVFIPSKLLAESQREGFFSETARSLPHLSSNAPKLTDRQKDVLMLLAKGAPIKRICLELNLSEGTVKTHVAAIYRIFGASNRGASSSASPLPSPFASPPLRFPSRAGSSTNCGFFTTLLLACPRYDTCPKNTTFFLIRSH